MIAQTSILETADPPLAFSCTYIRVLGSPSVTQSFAPVLYIYIQKVPQTPNIELLIANTTPSRSSVSSKNIERKHLDRRCRTIDIGSVGTYNVFAALSIYIYTI